LQIVDLSKPPAFEALSYVWGDSSITIPIIVDGDTFQATANLNAALRALRRPQSPRLMWVDAICINQSDIPEKNVQVSLMSKLYSGAASIVVWLGPSTPDIEFAVSWAQSYAVKKFTAKSIFWLKLSTLALFSEEAKIKRSLEMFRVHRGILDIFCLPYWDRMWTFQKYVLAKEEPVCICGELEFRVTVL